MSFLKKNSRNDTLSNKNKDYAKDIKKTIDAI